MTREDFEQRFSQVLSLQTRRRGAPERKGQPRFQFVCFEAASVNLKVSEGEEGIPNDSRRVLTPKASRALFLSS